VEPVIYAADVGSIPQGNFGWVRLDAEHDGTHVEHDGDGAEIRGLVDAVQRDLVVDGRQVALGFECPLFVPVPRDPRRLGAARPGEGSHPFSAGAGTGALVTGLVQTAWILRELRDRCPDAVAFADWTDFVNAGGGLFLWEAFVSGSAKIRTHVDDARVAAATFRDSLPNPLTANAVEAQNPLSLVGTALLWSGWSRDVALLHEPRLLIKAGSPAAVRRPVGKAGRRTTSSSAASAEPLRVRVIRAAQETPRGRWTTYRHIGKRSAAIPIAVGGAIAAGRP
jgi:hypothetical protein